MKVKEYPNAFAKIVTLVFTPAAELGRGAKKSSVRPMISLTTIPSRVETVAITIRSLLNQNCEFERIILWLHHDLKKVLPSALTALACDRFEIRYSGETGSHRKLVETLRCFPDSTIVTCDDDYIYPQDWLNRLLIDHERYPRDIIAHECREICMRDGHLLPYEQWTYRTDVAASTSTLAIGYAGVLYPPHSLHSETTNALLYDKLAPNSDDLWFKVMSLRVDTRTRRSLSNRPKPTPIPYSQSQSLKTQNIDNDLNRVTWEVLSRHFSLSLDLSEYVEKKPASKRKNVWLLQRAKLHFINVSVEPLWWVRGSFAKLTRYHFLRKKFIRKLEYTPNFFEPVTFNERIQHKKLFDRSKLLVKVSDKLLVRDYIIDTLGEEGKKYLVPLIGYYHFPEDIPLNILPNSFVLKANHGSGTNLIVRNKNTLSNDALITLCYKWLQRAYGLSSYQWAYTKIKKRLLIEELLLTEQGQIPEDYKVHIIKGKCLCIQVDYGRKRDQSRTLYDVNWNVLPFTTRHQQKVISEKPKKLEEILDVSLKVAENFEYARVDWYILGERMYIGEITQYPGGGLLKFIPEKYDVFCGAFWEGQELRDTEAL